MSQKMFVLIVNGMLDTYKWCKCGAYPERSIHCIPAYDALYSLLYECLSRDELELVEKWMRKKKRFSAEKLFNCIIWLRGENP